MRDVSTDRQFEDRLAAIERAGAELVDIDAEVIRAQHSAERLKTLEGRIAGIAGDLLRFDHFVVRLKDERTGRLEPVMAVGLPRKPSTSNSSPRRRATASAASSPRPAGA